MKPRRTSQKLESEVLESEPHIRPCLIQTDAALVKLKGIAMQSADDTRTKKEHM